MDLYQQAANKFKMAKKWSAAAHAFTELASLYAKAGSRLDAATNYVEAGNCYKKTDPNGNGPTRGGQTITSISEYWLPISNLAT